jgi:hypothetical protein
LEPSTLGWTATHTNYRVPPLDAADAAEVYGLYSKPDVTVHNVYTYVDETVIVDLAASLPSSWNVEPTISQPTYARVGGGSSGAITGVYEYQAGDPPLTTNYHFLSSTASYVGEPQQAAIVEHGKELLTAVAGYIQLSWPDALNDGTYGLFVAKVTNQSLFNSASTALRSSTATEDAKAQARIDIMASVSVKLNNCVDPDLLAYLVAGTGYFVA